MQEQEVLEPIDRSRLVRDKELGEFPRDRCNIHFSADSYEKEEKRCWCESVCVCPEHAIARNCWIRRIPGVCAISSRSVYLSACVSSQ